MNETGNDKKKCYYKNKEKGSARLFFFCLSLNAIKGTFTTKEYFFFKEKFLNVHGKSFKIASKKKTALIH